MPIKLPVGWKKHWERGKAKVEHSEADLAGKPWERKSTPGIVMVVDWLEESSRRDGAVFAALYGL